MITLGESFRWDLAGVMCRTTALPRVKPVSGIAIHQQVENLACGAMEWVECGLLKNNKYLLMKIIIQVGKSHAY